MSLQRSLIFCSLFCFVIGVPLFSANATPGFCGNSLFPGILDKLAPQLDAYAAAPAGAVGQIRFNAILSNFFYSAPETLIRFQNTNLLPFYFEALTASTDAFILNKTLYGLRYYAGRFIPADKIFPLLSHPNTEVRANAVFLIGMYPALFGKEDILLRSEKETNFLVHKVYEWSLSRFASPNEILVLKQFSQQRTLIDEAFYYRAGASAPGYIPAHAEPDNGHAEPPIASRITPPVIDYDKELVFTMPRQSFGIGTENIHLGDDCAWFRDGTPVFAISDGIVRLVISSMDWGNLVVIEHKMKNTNYFCSIYGHLGNTVLVVPGQSVVAGQLIGMTGMSYSYENGGYGSHLHFSVAEGKWQKPRYQKGRHLRVTMDQKQVAVEIVGFDKKNVVVRFGDKFFGIEKDEDTLNDRIQWIKGYQMKEDGTNGWMDPWKFIVGFMGR